MDIISILLFQLVIGKTMLKEYLIYIRHTQEIMGKLTKYCREKALQSGLSRRDATSIQNLWLEKRGLSLNKQHGLHFYKPKRMDILGFLPYFLV